MPLAGGAGKSNNKCAFKLSISYENQAGRRHPGSNSTCPWLLSGYLLRLILIFFPSDCVTTIPPLFLSKWLRQIKSSPRSFIWPRDGFYRRKNTCKMGELHRFYFPRPKKFSSIEPKFCLHCYVKARSSFSIRNYGVSKAWGVYAGACLSTSDFKRNSNTSWIPLGLLY